MTGQVLPGDPVRVVRLVERTEHYGLVEDIAPTGEVYAYSRTGDLVGLVATADPDGTLRRHPDFSLVEINDDKIQA